MKEVWEDISEFPGYQVSNTGKVRTFWKKQKRKGTWGGTERVLVDEPRELPQSFDSCGYKKVYLQNENKRKCAKVHRLVAEAFIPRKEGCDTVDHILSGKEGKLDNSITNLRWMSRRDNIQKAYRDGMCDDRIESQNKPVMMRDLWTGETRIAPSVWHASEIAKVHYTSISHALRCKGEGRVSHFEVWRPTREDLLLYSAEIYGGRCGG